MLLYFVVIFMLKEIIIDKEKLDRYVIVIVCKFVINVFKISFNEICLNCKLVIGLVGVMKRLKIFLKKFICFLYLKLILVWNGVFGGVKIYIYGK